jgi:signal transduction histidine kinase
MSKEDKKSLFKKFGVLESSRDMNSNGLGLGLYISKSILNKLGGEIT